MGLSGAAACSLQFIVLVGLLAMHTQGRLRSPASLAKDATAQEALGDAAPMESWGERGDLTDVTTAPSELGTDYARRWRDLVDNDEIFGDDVELPSVTLVEVDEEVESGNGTNHSRANLTTVDCDNKTKSKPKTIKVELTAAQQAAKKEKAMRASLKAMNLSKSNLTNSTGNVSNKTANVSKWADNLISNHTKACNGPNASNISNCTEFMKNGTNSSYNATHVIAKKQQAAKEKSQKALAKKLIKPPCNTSNASNASNTSKSADTTAGGTGTDATDTTEMPNEMQKTMIEAGAGGDSTSFRWSSLEDLSDYLVDLHA